MIVCTFNSFFSVFYIPLVASVMLSIYPKLFNNVLAIRERESGSKQANCVYLSRIENSSDHQELDFLISSLWFWYVMLPIFFAPQIFTSVVSGWVIIWGICHELYVCTVFLISTGLNNLRPTTWNDKF